MAHFTRSTFDRTPQAGRGQAFDNTGNVQGLLVRLQKDLTLLAEGIQRSALPGGKGPEAGKEAIDPLMQVHGDTAESAANAASTPEEMWRAIEEVYRSGARITTALDASRVT